MAGGGGGTGAGLTEGCKSEPQRCLFPGVHSRTSLSLSFSGHRLMGLNNKISKAVLKSRPLSALGIDDEQEAGFLEGLLGLWLSQANGQKLQHLEGEEWQKGSLGGCGCLG